MSIESTKKIIATVIVVIMLLGITTPTFAATTNNMKINLGTIFGKTMDIAGKVGEIALPAIGKVVDAVNKIDMSTITVGLQRTTVNLGTNIFERLSKTTLPVVNKDNDEKTSTVSNVLDDTITGIKQMKDYIENEAENNEENGNKTVETLTTLRNGLSNLKNRAMEVINNKIVTNENQGNTTGLSNIIKNIFNKEYIREKVEEVKSELVIKEDEENSKETTNALGFMGKVVNFFKNKINIDTHIDNENEKSNFAEKANEIKTYISQNNYKYQYTHSEDPYSEENRKINCSQYVSWVIYEYAKENGNIVLENVFEESRGSKQIYAYMVLNPLQFEAKGNLSQIDPSQLQEGDIIVKKVDITEELQEELGIIEESDGGHIEIFAGYDENGNILVYNAGSDACLDDVISVGQCNGNLEDYETFKMR